MATFVHGVGTRVLYNGADISSYLDKADWSGVAAVNETTTFGVPSSAKTYIRGINDGTFSASGFWDGSANAIDSILATARTATTDDVLTHAPAGLAVGNQINSMQVRATDFKTSSPVNNVTAISATFQSDGPVGDKAVSLHNLQAETTSGNSATVDNGASSTAGADAIVHITAITGTATIKVQHSADNVTYVDLVTIASGVSSVGGYRAIVAVGTTINRYTQGNWSPATSTTFAISFNRR